GRRQLAGVLRLEAFDARLPADGELPGLAMRHLLDGLDLAAVPAGTAEALDVDLPVDLNLVRDQFM
ncbi:MAG: hypothetical protein ACRCYQ_16970, partial [Nocardioides sp.]